MALAEISKYAPADFESSSAPLETNSGVGTRRSVTLVTDIAFWERTYGSHTRIRGLLRSLAVHHDVRVFFLKSLTHEIQEGFAGLRLPGARIVSYKEFSGLRRPVPKILRKLNFFKSAPDDFVSAFHAYLQKNPSDVVVFEYIRLGYLLDACPPGVQSVLDMHDVMSERMMSLASAGMKPSIMLPMAVEKRILQAFDRILTISRADQSHVENVMGLDNALYVPSAVEEPEAIATVPANTPPVDGYAGVSKWSKILGLKPTAKKALPTQVPHHAPEQLERDPSGRRLLFLGAKSEVNLAGLKWFLDQVWPILATQGFHLDVVGRVAEAFYDAVEGVVFHGRQEDLSPFFQQANISINPVFVGGGLKIKCVDALAAGMPCVTTPEGAAGLDMARYAGLYVCRSRLEFAQQITTLSKNHTERQRISKLAPLFIENEFSQERAFIRLQSWLQALPSPHRV